MPFYDPSQFFVARMLSEYGMQSYPSIEGLEAVYEDADMEYDSDLNNYRNHHPNGELSQTLFIFFSFKTEIIYFYLESKRKIMVDFSVI